MSFQPEGAGALHEFGLLTLASSSPTAESFCSRLLMADR